MPLLHCPRCGRDISAMDKQCPVCGTRISFRTELRYQIEHSRPALAGVIVAAVLLLGVGWFLRMDSGVKWPLYVIIIALAPLVPWLLKVVYQTAAPLPDEEKSGDARVAGSEETSGPSGGHTDDRDGGR